METNGHCYGCAQLRLKVEKYKGYKKRYQAERQEVKRIRAILSSLTTQSADAATNYDLIQHGYSLESDFEILGNELKFVLTRNLQLEKRLDGMKNTNELLSYSLRKQECTLPPIAVNSHLDENLLRQMQIIQDDIERTLSCEINYLRGVVHAQQESLKILSSRNSDQSEMDARNLAMSMTTKQSSMSDSSPHEGSGLRIPVSLEEVDNQSNHRNPHDRIPLKRLDRMESHRIPEANLKGAMDDESLDEYYALLSRKLRQESESVINQRLPASVTHISLQNSSLDERKIGSATSRFDHDIDSGEFLKEQQREGRLCRRVGTSGSYIPDAYLDQDSERHVNEVVRQIATVAQKYYKTVHVEDPGVMVTESHYTGSPQASAHLNPLSTPSPIESLEHDDCIPDNLEIPRRKASQLRAASASNRLEAAVAAVALEEEVDSILRELTGLEV